MNRICWWLADIVSRILEPEERDAVYGDHMASLQVSRDQRKLAAKRHATGARAEISRRARPTNARASFREKKAGKTRVAVAAQ
jgi:hypothetical protein